VVDTSKAAVEVESFHDGVIEELLVEPGTTVPVGAVLARFGADGAAAPAPAAESATAPAAAPVATPAVAPPAPPEPARSPAAASPVPVHSPLVRREAARLGVDLGQVTGTGRGGTITRDDVHAAAGRAVTTGRPRVSPYARRLAAELGVDLAAVSTPGGAPVRAADVRAAASGTVGTTAPPADRAAAPSPARHAPRDAGLRTGSEAMRATIASLMARSKREIPHYYLSTTVDLGAALAWMRERNRELPVTERLVPAALVLKAVAMSLVRSPELNGFWVDGAFVPGSGIHLGVAVSLRGGGLVAPALHDADQLSVGDLMAAMRDLVQRARAGRLRGSEMTDPTLTVTNLGDQGVESVHGVIYPPQVALVGCGRVVDRPWAVDGMLTVRPVTTITLAADHRATDGFTGARFLNDVDRHLQTPEEL
jgi:pyruvate dehydrogenase E2 component (dihydrolipoamide acetyltransferase)